MEAEDYENPTSIIVLPPRYGDRHIYSDAEDVTEGFKDEFEPAGELEVEFEDSEEILSDSSVDLSERPTSK